MEQFSDVSVTFKEVHITGNQPFESDSDLYLTYLFTGGKSPKQLKSGSVKSSHATWPELDQLFVQTSLKELLSEQLVVKIHQQQRLKGDIVIGESAFKIKNYLNLNQHGVAIKEPIVKDGNTIGYLEGILIIGNVPKFGQLIGAKYTETGILGGQLALPGIQAPKGFQVTRTSGIDLGSPLATVKNSIPNAQQNTVTHNSNPNPQANPTNPTTTTGGGYYPDLSGFKTQILGNFSGLTNSADQIANPKHNLSNSQVVDSQDTLPQNWEKRVDVNTGKHYYVDHNTKTTHWSIPPSAYQAAAPSSTGAPSTGVPANTFTNPALYAPTPVSPTATPNNATTNVSYNSYGNNQPGSVPGNVPGSSPYGLPSGTAPPSNSTGTTPGAYPNNPYGAPTGAPTAPPTASPSNSYSNLPHGNYPQSGIPTSSNPYGPPTGAPNAPPTSSDPYGTPTSSTGSNPYGPPTGAPTSTTGNNPYGPPTGAPTAPSTTSPNSSYNNLPSHGNYSQSTPTQPSGAPTGAPATTPYDYNNPYGAPTGSPSVSNTASPNSSYNNLPQHDPNAYTPQNSSGSSTSSNNPYGAPTSTNGNPYGAPASTNGSYGSSTSAPYNSSGYPGNSQYNNPTSPTSTPNSYYNQQQQQSYPGSSNTGYGGYSSPTSTPYGQPQSTTYPPNSAYPGQPGYGQPQQPYPGQQSGYPQQQQPYPGQPGYPPYGQQPYPGQSNYPPYGY